MQVMPENEEIIEFDQPLTAMLGEKPVKITGYIPAHPPKFRWQGEKSAGIATSEEIDIDINQNFSFRSNKKIGREIPPGIKRIVEERLREEELIIKQEMENAKRKFRHEIKSGGIRAFSNHMADTAPHASETDAQAYRIKICDKRLAKIQTARLRLALGTFGLCEICGEEIPVERLEKIPFAHDCVACKEGQEKKPKFATKYRRERRH